VDVADVIVCAGFVGNVMLKAAEGLGEMMLGMLKEVAATTPAVLPVLKAMARKLDYAEYGGAPLLGVRGGYIIGHGRSDGRAVANAIRAARDYLLAGVDAKIAADLVAAPVGGTPA